MKLLIGADIVPTKSNQKYFINGDIDKLIDEELKTVLTSADYRIFNLEVPLTNVAAPIEKCGPNLIASTNTVTGLRKLGVDFVTLANNHILDQGEQGLKSTVEVLDAAGIAHGGTGGCLTDAAKPYIIDRNDTKIGIYCCAEHEFSIVSERFAGANPFDPLESLEHITLLKAQCDYIIVLYHGGKEHYRYPSPNLQKTCRKIIEKGADLVVCQHTHCIGCEEEWLGGTIVYGQGNFLFDYQDNEFWQTGLLISVDTSSREIEYIPLKKNAESVKLGENKVLDEFKTRSNEIKADGFVDRKYDDFANSMISGYLTSLHGQRTFLFKVFDRLTKRKLGAFFAKRRYKRGNRVAIRNFIECEAHRELIIRGLKNK